MLCAPSASRFEESFLITALPWKLLNKPQANADDAVQSAPPSFDRLMLRTKQKPLFVKPFYNTKFRLPFEIPVSESAALQVGNVKDHQAESNEHEDSIMDRLNDDDTYYAHARAISAATPTRAASSSSSALSSSQFTPFAQWRDDINVTRRSSGRFGGSNDGIKNESSNPHAAGSSQASYFHAPAWIWNPDQTAPVDRSSITGKKTKKNEFSNSNDDSDRASEGGGSENEESFVAGRTVAKKPTKSVEFASAGTDGDGGRRAEEDNELHSISRQSASLFGSLNNSYPTVCACLQNTGRQDLFSFDRNRKCNLEPTLAFPCSEHACLVPHLLLYTLQPGNGIEDEDDLDEYEIPGDSMMGMNTPTPHKLKSQSRLSLLTNTQSSSSSAYDNEEGLRGNTLSDGMLHKLNSNW
jgi:hypothetical protein